MVKQPGLNDDERESLIAYLDGELDAQTARSIETKLASDARFRAEADSLTRTWQMLDYLPQPQASAEFTSRTLERVSVIRPASAPAAAPTAGPSRWQPWAIGAGWAAAVLLAFFGGYTGVKLMLVPTTNSAAVEATVPADIDQQLVQDLRVIDNKRLYELVDDINLLRELDDPDLFGDDG